MNSHAPPLSWAAVGGVLVVVVTGIVTHGPTPESLRPSSATKPPDTFNSPGKIPARLWQGPIEIGWNQIQQTKTAFKDNAAGELERQWEGADKLIKSTSGAITIDKTPLEKLARQYALEKLKVALEKEPQWKPDWSNLATVAAPSLEAFRVELTSWAWANHKPTDNEPFLNQVFTELGITKGKGRVPKFQALMETAATLFFLHSVPDGLRTEFQKSNALSQVTTVPNQTISGTQGTNETPATSPQVSTPNDEAKLAVIEKLKTAKAKEIVEHLSIELGCENQDQTSFEEQAKTRVPIYQKASKAALAGQPKIDLVLPIVITGLLDADQREIRLRSRYALQEAMDLDHYRSLNASDLGYFPVPLCTDDDHGVVGTIQKKDQHTNSTPPKSEEPYTRSTDFLPVTFELFQRQEDAKSEGDKAKKEEGQKPYQRICVLWMDHRILGPGDSPRYANVTEIAQTVAKGAQLSDIITLSPSEELKSLLEDITTEIPDGSQTGQKVTLHYARSTWLPKKLPKGEQKTANIQRIIPVDEYSLRAIIGELSLRNASLANALNGAATKPEVWLFKEQDTLYSAAMDGTFKDLVGDCWTVESFDYLRGLDGGMSPESTASSHQAGTPAQQLLETLGKTVFAPGASTAVGFDQRQVDYLERMADRLLKHQRENKAYHQRVQAIGIVGSDVYDKLMVLQILKKRFPSALFFTTDLDAIYLHPGLRGVTQNLLIGSSYSLESFALDGKSRCFRQAQMRDCYQVAFIDCLRQVISGIKPVPPVVKVYEVGRQAFHPTDTTLYPESLKDRWTPTQTSGVEWYKKSFALLPKEEMKPMQDFTWLPTRILRSGLGSSLLSQYASFPLLIAVSLLVYILLLLASHRNLRTHDIWWICKICRWIRNKVSAFIPTFRFQSSAAPAKPKKSSGTVAKSGSTLSAFRLWDGPSGRALIIFSFLALIPAVKELFSKYGEPFFGIPAVAEPFSLFGGISIWPSILIRMAALVIVGFLISQSIGTIFQKVKMLEGVEEDKEKEAHYKRMIHRSPHTAAGIALLGAAVLGIVYMLCLEVGDPFLTPARGYSAFLFHELTMFPCLAALLFASAWSYVVHFHTESLLISIAKRANAAPLNDDQANALIAISQPVANSVFPPFALMVMLLASRHTVFDGWNIPYSLLVVQGGLLFIVILTSFFLSRAAWRLRRAEKRKLQTIGKSSAEKAAMQKEDIWETATGPFAHLQSQPLMQALLLVLAGIGLNVAEPLLKFFGM
jgi:hypothetical protein